MPHGAPPRRGAERRRTEMSRHRKALGILGALLWFALAALLPREAAAQGLSDLLGKKPGTAGQSSGDSLDLRFGRDRSDLSLSPNLRPILAPEKKFVGLSAQA